VMTGQLNFNPMRRATVRKRSSPISMFLGCKRSQCASQLSSESMSELSPTVDGYFVYGMIQPYD
jgi:hypothetical protein